MTRWLPERKDRRVPTTTDVFLLYHLGLCINCQLESRLESSRLIESESTDSLLPTLLARSRDRAWRRPMRTRRARGNDGCCPDLKELVIRIVHVNTATKVDRLDVSYHSTLAVN